ncbi:MAG: UvrD-helicase domain-containing protein [Candidatus Firestonebacteria bacterium]|nr:UvrD-helicase domain-containing protein [Candidatus Firestonebacteria bacterium]
MPSKIDLSTLNQPQREAVEHGEGPLLILAGAGSGKTRVVTFRIAYLIEARQVAPEAIMAVTFTNKAAGEMKERVNFLLGKEAAKKVWIGTFHALCLRMLKIESPEPFTIYDEEDCKRLIKECQRELNLDEKTLKADQIGYRIESAKNELIDENQYAELASDFTTRLVAKVYKRYQQKLATNHAVDFGDLIFKVVQLFDRNPEVLAKYRRTFQYILVDEYQDINHSQYGWVRRLVNDAENLTVVGDDDQSIYQFRGADVRNILEFERDFPRARVIKLEQNYRSTQTILEAAWSVVKNNSGRKEKKLWTENPTGEPLFYFRAESEAEEASFVVREILRTTGGRYGKRARLADCVVLYRTNAQSRPFEDALRRERLPYRIVGGMKFYDRMEIKDVLSYLKFLVNPADELSLGRIINTPPRGLGDGALGKIREVASRFELSMFGAMERMTLSPEEVPERVLRSAAEFVRLIHALLARMDVEDLPTFLTSVVMETGYLGMWQNTPHEEGASRVENLNELIAAADEFRQTGDNTVKGFLDQIALAASWDEQDSDGDQVTLMTFHSAKGLEFPLVFMVGMEEGLFPHANAMQAENGLSEERRLCYVGITRARERLLLTGASTRLSFGNRVYNSESRFLLEIPARCLAGATPLAHQRELKVEAMKGLWGGKSYGGAKDVFADPPAPEDVSQEVKHVLADDEPGEDGLRAGRKVRHSKFGTGTIIGRTGEGENMKVEIAFNRAGRKQMLVRFAALELL